MNRMEEAIDRYCECYSLLKPQEDAHKLRAEVVHSAITIALELGQNLGHFLPLYLFASRNF